MSQFMRRLAHPRFSSRLSLAHLLPLAVVAMVAVLVVHVGRAVAVPLITASKTDVLLVDSDNDSLVSPGDTLEYTVVIQNSDLIGSTDATGVAFSDTLDANTTLVPGSIKTTPIARNDGPYASLGNVGIVVPAGSGVLANDNDPDGSGGVTFFSAGSTSANGGNVSVNTDGSFTYYPPPGFEGSDTFTYAIQDGDGNQDSATVTVNVSGMVWFIDNSGGAGDGRLSSPFNNIGAFNAIQTGAAPNAKDGDIIFIGTGSGSYSTGIQLRNDQVLLGQGVSLSDQLGLLGTTVPPNSNPLPAASTRPNIAPGTGNGIRLAANNVVRGLNLGNSPGGTGIVDNGNVGNLVIDSVAISGSGGGINLVNGGTISVALDGLSASSTTDEGIHLVNVDGSFEVQSGTISTSIVPAVDIDGNTSLALNVTLTSVSASSAANGILIRDTSGSFTVTGSGSTNGSGGTISSVTTRGASFINATNVALNNMTLSSASTTNGGSGCTNLLNSGCNAAIHLENTNGVTLTNVDISTTAQQGINGLNVTDFTLVNSTATNCGDQVNEGCLRLVDLAGTAVISASDLSFAAERVAQIENTNVTLALTVSGSTFRDTQSSGTGADGLEVTSSGASNTTIDISNSSFLRNRTNGLQVFSVDTSIVSVDVTGSTFDRGTGIGTGMDLAADNTATLHFNVIGNPLINSQDGSAINVFAGGNATVQGRINNNPNIQAGGCVALFVCSSGFGIFAQANANSAMRIEIDNNIISNIGYEAGIQVISQMVGSSRLDATINNNTITLDPAGSSSYDIGVLAGSNQAGENNTTCANVTNNSASGNGLVGAAFWVQEAGGSVLLQGFNTDATTTWNNNNNSPLGSVIEIPAPGSASGGTCNTVSHPALSLAPNSTVATSQPASPPASEPAPERTTETEASQARQSGGATPALKNVADLATLRYHSAAAVKSPLEPTSGEAINVSLGLLNPGQQVTITFAATVDEPFAASTSQVCNQGQISGSNFSSVLTDDPDVGGTADATCTPIDAAPDLSLAKDDGGISVQPGDTITYTLTYTNTGNQIAAGVKLTDTIPANTSFNPGASTAGWICLPDNSAGSTCTLTAGEVVAGAPASTAEFAVDVDAPLPRNVTQISNTAGIQDDGSGGADSNPADNHASDVTPVIANLFSIGFVTAAEGDAGATSFTFAISRTNTVLASSVQYETADGTATAGTDYAAVELTTINFTAGGSPTQTITIEVSGDTLFEADETFFVTLSNPTNGEIDRATGIGIITNEDSPPAISVSDVTVDEAAGTAVFTVTLSAVSGLETRLDYSTADDTAIAPDDYTAIPTTTLVIPAGSSTGSIVVAIVDDALTEGIESFFVILSNPKNATSADNQAEGHILDDDTIMIYLPLVLK